MMEIIYLGYAIGVLGCGAFFTVWAVIMLAMRAYKGLMQYVDSGFVASYEHSWNVYHVSNDNNPVGIMVDTVIYGVIVIIAAFAWPASILPALGTLVARIKRYQRLREEEADRIVERLEGA